MKKTALIIALSVIIFSCNSINEEGFTELNSVRKPKKHYFSILEIDGCEYLYRGSELSHKGDCKNKIHRCNN